MVKSLPPISLRNCLSLSKSGSSEKLIEVDERERQGSRSLDTLKGNALFAHRKHNG